MAAILIIDDSPTVFLALRAVLQLDRHTVHRLDSAIDAPRYLHENRIDLIILDLQMPMFSGFSIGALIRDFDKKQTPILIYSSRPTYEIEAIARRLGAAGYMEKAKPLMDLRALVNQVIHDKAA